MWGAAAWLPARDLARAALPLALAGFGVAAASGLVMFAASPGELLAHRAFIVKTGLLLAGGNAAAFHARGGLARPDGWARAQAPASIGLRLAIAGCGRWIAYLGTGVLQPG